MLIIGGCSQFYSSEEIDCTDIRLFNQTPAWELVKAIEKDDSKKIKEILHKNLLLSGKTFSNKIN